jgi:hypothetical protein
MFSQVSRQRKAWLLYVRTATRSNNFNSPVPIDSLEPPNAEAKLRSGVALRLVGNTENDYSPIESNGRKIFNLVVSEIGRIKLKARNATGLTEWLAAGKGQCCHFDVAEIPET